MAGPGARNLITDVAGLRVGNAEDANVRTGVTVILPDAFSTAVIDVRGGAPGTRDSDALDPVAIDGGADAIVLSGGSVYGLDAPAGVTALLREQGRGILFGGVHVPVVPGAILFDLTNGGDKEWGAETPYRRLGRAAAESAGLDFKLGNVGAGLGARAGAYNGGLGSTSTVTDDGFTIGAVVAVNSLGSPLIPGTDVFWSFPFEQEREFGGRQPRGPVAAGIDLPPDMKGALPRENTTIAAVAVDAEMTGVELKRIAIMAQDGFARALRPIHTPFDGDVVFAVATGKRPLGEPRARQIMRLGHIAADTLARAIARGVYEAETLGAMKSYRDMFP
jgi:L-aminopeptidase/D-esterase-like protein